ncbi:MAG: DNA glycosylase [Bacillota bacterium]|nr:DNA glycosylase [Bacillota bacterium]
MSYEKVKRIGQVEIAVNDNVIEMAGVRDFNPDQIFDCGQCFRWEKDHKSWLGIAGARVARVSYDSDGKLLRIEQLGSNEPSQDRLSDVAFWWNYFDLDRDYEKIKAYLSEGDPVMKEASNFGSGIRILRQDFWEALISFIISQNNNIPRIKKCINSLAEALGEKVAELEDGSLWYSLPNPEVLARATEEELSACKLGYRSKYLIEAAKQYIRWTEERDMNAQWYVTRFDEASKLEAFCGVGPKVANCVGLFGLGLIDSFPIDVWIRRIMNEFYGIPEKDLKGMKAYAAEHFAPYGGIAQQYLFYRKLVDKSGK